MIVSTHIKARRVAASLLKGRPRPRDIGRTNGGLSWKLHFLCDRLGRPLRVFFSSGQVGDAKGALALLDAVPPAKALLAYKGLDAYQFCEAPYRKETGV